MNKKIISPKTLGYFLVNLISIVVLLVLDQWTKQLASTHLKGSSGISIIKDVFELYYLENRGVAFGMMQNQKPIIITVGLIMMIVVFFFMFRVKEAKNAAFARVCLILIAAGGIGNMIDRLCNDFVTDFFSFVLIHFPIFNVADIYIVVGTILLSLYILFFSEDTKKESENKIDNNQTS